ncbi:MAG: hypothetical protein LAQ69_42080 [Acidobacteriia bacterium]|nr:hypothetical protein [Terriglobia bacterium]
MVELIISPTNTDATPTAILHRLNVGETSIATSLEAWFQGTADRSGGGSDTQSSDPNRAPVVSIASHETFKPALVSIADIYYSPESIGSPYLRNALRLLSMAVKNVESALELLSDGDMIGGDDAMQHYQVLLPELFACRSIGEGFGLLVSSLLNAVTSLRGQSMVERQVRAVRSVLIELSSEPFMSFDAALVHVLRLEQADLNVDPPNFEFLAE